MSTSLYYRVLAAAVFPFFRPKLNDISGWENLPVSGGYVLAINHIDWLDGFYIAAAFWLHRHIKVHFLTKSNNYWWTSVAVQIPPSEAGSIIDHAVTTLRSGKVIGNFIEGQRNDDAKLLPGKTGTVRMAMAAGVPIVPVGITCSAGKNMLESISFLRSNDKHVRIRIGQPVELKIPVSVDETYLRAVTNEVMNAISPLCGKRV